MTLREMIRDLLESGAELDDEFVIRDAADNGSDFVLKRSQLTDTLYLDILYKADGPIE